MTWDDEFQIKGLKLRQASRCEISEPSRAPQHSQRGRWAQSSSKSEPGRRDFTRLDGITTGSRHRACFADDVVRADAGDFIGRCNEIWWQLIAGRMRSFFVVVPTPDSADVVQVFFGDDNELVETLELQSLDESFDMGPQNRGHRNRPFDLNTAGFEHFASSRISSGVQGRPGFLFDAASFSACDLFFPNPPNEGVINDGRNQIPKLNSQLLTDLQ